MLRRCSRQKHPGCSRATGGTNGRRLLRPCSRERSCMCPARYCCTGKPKPRETLWRNIIAASTDKQTVGALRKKKKRARKKEVLVVEKKTKKVTLWNERPGSISCYSRIKGLVTTVYKHDRIKCDETEKQKKSSQSSCSSKFKADETKKASGGRRTGPISERGSAQQARGFVMLGAMVPYSSRGRGPGGA